MSKAQGGYPNELHTNNNLLKAMGRTQLFALPYRHKERAENNKGHAEIHKGHELINVRYELINVGHELINKGHAARHKGHAGDPYPTFCQHSLASRSSRQGGQSV